MQLRNQQVTINNVGHVLCPSLVKRHVQADFPWLVMKIFYLLAIICWQTWQFQRHCIKINVMRRVRAPLKCMQNRTGVQRSQQTKLTVASYESQHQFISTS